MKKIHVGFLVSYDYELLKKAIPFVYDDADKIFLAIDQNLKTWKGDTFSIDNRFFEWIEEIDIKDKIVIYKANFYVKGLTTMECEVRERMMLSQEMGLDNWCVQLDADEYFVDFKSFVKDLKDREELLEPNKKPIQIAAFLYNMYKKIDNGYLLVEEPTRVLVTTNQPDYRVGRKAKQQIIYTRHVVLHECLSRTEAELEQKLENWGHNTQVNDSFMTKWKSVNSENYKSMQNFFYIEPEKWKNLIFIKGQNIAELKTNLLKRKDILPSKFFVFGKNFGQWFKFLFK
ncbi:hypothetical protein [uncultured Psychroserpens sp.]|uniref:hypothetical protein n=1 Tax=uncultured Psychroserpens sp. TaxID=255436 RepID=UPI0026318310|nr:hypothetical protein [uncultured Psychroserpens sp.]